MTYRRKTQDEYELQGNYGRGWECLTTEETYVEANLRRREYRGNEGGSYRIVKRRVPLSA